MTGAAFLSIIVVLTVLAFAAAVVAWPLLAGASPGRIAGRVGVLLAVNVMVLLTAATQLNAQFLFFADWTDLQGAMGGTTTSTSLARGGGPAKAAGTQVKGVAATAGVTQPALPAGAATASTLTYTVKGPLSGVTGTVVVGLPAGYTDAAHAATRYPVMEAFQGYPGSVHSWISTINLPADIAAQVNAHRMRAAIVVAPQVELPAGVDTECVNGTAGRPQLETFLTRDVPDFVARTFRVETNRSSWATIGLSTGGWCAAMSAMLHPAQYAAAIVMGGYFRPQFGPFYLPYPSSSPLTKRYDLVALAHHSPPTAIWLETSHADPVSFTSSAAFLKSARAPLGISATVLQNAGHRISLWAGLVPSSLDWLGRNVPGFAPLP